jgi:DNA adenine methylase
LKRRRAEVSASPTAGHSPTALGRSRSARTTGTSSIRRLGPILRWAGSKRQLVPKITGLFPLKYRRYIEPFAGSACVFAALAPRKAILSDINSELIRTYRTLVKSPDAIGDILNSWDLKKTTYYRIRGQNPKTLDSIHRAARFIYLNRRCFNGVFRLNRKGQFNVPLGRRTGPMPTNENLADFGQILSRAVLRACDFEKSVLQAKKGDLLYVDPPYTRPGTRFRGEYGWNAFRAADEKRLVESVSIAARRGATVVLSYRGSIGAKLRGWRRHHVRVLRSVSGFSAARGRVVEVLFTSPALVPRLRRRREAR